MAGITIAAVGDVMVNAPLGASPLYEILRKSTVATANLESPLTDWQISASPSLALKSPPSVADHLPRLGLHVVSVANNHAMDYTDKGLMDTIKYVTGAGVKTVGGGRNLEESLAPAIVEAGGLKIAFVGMASTLPPGSAATDHKPGIAPIRVYSSIAVDSTITELQPGTSPYVHTKAVQPDVDIALEAIRKTKKTSDLVIVSIHWGVPIGWMAPFHGTLAEYQAPLGRALIDAGTDIILGHHPHVIHGIEIYRGGLIFYSLGHFIFQFMKTMKKEVPRYGRPTPPYRREYLDLASPLSRESVVAVIYLETSEKRDPKISGVEMTPCMLEEDGEPVESSPEEANRILSRLKSYSEELGTPIRISGNKGYLDMT